MPDTSYVEVRCERCKTTFAPGTKQCIHCGGAIGRRLLAFDQLLPGGASPPGEADRAPGTPDPQPSIGGMFRIAVIALVVVSAIVRACVEAN